MAMILPPQASLRPKLENQTTLADTGYQGSPENFQNILHCLPGRADKMEANITQLQLPVLTVAKEQNKISLHPGAKQK